MSIADKLATVAENMQKVYDAGKAAGGGVDEKYIIEKTITGKGVVYADDVSEYTHDVGVRLSSDTITDFSGVTLARNGKNLLPYPYQDTAKSPKTHKGITFTDNGDGSITIKGTATGEAYFILSHKYFGDGRINAISNDGTTNGEYAVSKRLFYGGASDPTLSVNIVTGATVNETIWPQVEYGTSPTSYEPYQEPVIYTAKADGTVSGVKSIAPYMTLSADADVGIEVNYHKSYGMQVEYDALWDKLQNNGNPRTYNYGFAGVLWNDETFKPKYDIYCGTGNCAYGTFYMSGITEINVPVDVRYATPLQSTFSQSSIKTIKLLKVTESTGFNASTFSSASKLENITIEGVIGKSLSMGSCLNLTDDSLTSITEALKDLSGTSETLTITLADDVKARMTNAQIAAITEKGWTLA